MENSASYRKNGTQYSPEYIESLSPEKCLGCGRCYKVCGEKVFELVERTELEIEDDDYEDEGAMVMSVTNDGNCIGCKACSRVCPRDCQIFIAVTT